MMLPLNTFVNALARWGERVLGAALIAGVSLNFVNVVGRYLGGFTLTGGDEIEIYILIWISFLGAAIVTWRREHLRMDVLLAMCPPRVRKIVVLGEMTLLFCITSFAAFQSFKYVERIHALGAVSDIAHIPTWIPHSAITIGFAAMALLVLLRGVQKLAGFESRVEMPPRNEAVS
jgi:TRAP-type C4-dicarboxylate transport system permease small subunit